MKQTTPLWKWMRAAAGLFLVGAVLTACSKDNDAPDVKVAGLTVFNMVPDKPGVNVWLSGNRLSATAFPYTGYSGGYYNIFPGNRVVESFSSQTGTGLDSTSYNFMAEKYYSLYVMGANGNYHNVISLDNYDTLSAASGKAFVRYVYGIPDSSTTQVTLQQNGSIVSDNNTRYGRFSNFMPVEPGDVAININNGSTISKSRTITVQARKAYTVLLLGIPGTADQDKAVQIRFVENGTITDD